MAIHIRTTWMLLPALAIGATVIAAMTITRADLAWFFERVPPERAAGGSAVPAPVADPAISRDMTPVAPPKPEPAPASPGEEARTPSLPAAKPGVERVEIFASRSEPRPLGTVSPPPALQPLATAEPPAPQPGETRDAIAIRRFAPPYEPVAHALKIEGTARIQAHVNAGGGVVSVRAVGGDAAFFVNSEVAMRAWRFAPALKEGVPVPSVVLVDFVFKLK
jgi:protein TonB